MEKNHIPKYEAALKGGKVLVVVHGSPQELETVRRVMGESGGQDVASYPAKAA